MYLENMRIGQKARMNDGWLFYWGEADVEKIRKMPEKEMKSVCLPHDWSIEFPFDEHADTLGAGGYTRAGKGWYKTYFTVDAGADDEQVILQFDGVYMNSKVWLNGRLLGGHIYGYTPFSFSVKEFLNVGKENELIVFVDNSAQPNSRWFSGSGITRPVFIYRENCSHIVNESVFVYTKTADFENKTAGIDLSGNVAVNDREVALTWQVTDCKGHVCEDGMLSLSDGIADGEGNVLEDRYIYATSGDAGNIKGFHTDITLKNVDFWDTKHPDLYVLKLTLTDTETQTVIDEKTWKFGVRTARFDAVKGFLLNEEQVKLNGVCLHHDGGCVGAAVPAKVWERRLTKLKAMGCNSLRFSHNPPDPALLDMCDTMGFLVMDEAFDEWHITKQKQWGSNTHESLGYSKWFDECGEDDMRAMLLRDRNHTSIVLWSIGNEVPEQLTADGWKVAKRLKEIVRSIDPTRKITQANDQIKAEPVPATEEFLNTLDVVGYNYADRWRGRAEGLYDDDRRVHPDWCVIGSENSSAGYIRNDARLDGDPWRAPYYSVPVRIGHLLRYTMTHDFVAGDYMWTGIDYIGEASWPNRSQTCGVLDMCGYEKDGYYFYKSIWKRDEPMVYTCPHWNLDCEPEKIVPVIGYTNCHSAELFLNGKSYGKKSYLYPAYGMSEHFGYWTYRKEFPNTDDLFLSWDVPYIPGTLTIVGYDEHDNEITRMERKTAGLPKQLIVKAWDASVSLDPDDVIQLEISVVDENGLEVPDAKLPIHLEVEGPAKIMGMDSGRADCHLMFGVCDHETFAGKAFAILKPLAEGNVTVTVSSPGLDGGSAQVEIIRKASSN